MIYVNDKNIKIQITKNILENILDSKQFHLELPTSKYWLKELIDVKLVDDKLIKSLKKIETITIANGMHSSLPVYTYHCLRYFINEMQDKFIFQLGDKIATKEPKVEPKKVLKVKKQLNLFD